MSSSRYRPWGNYPIVDHAEIEHMRWHNEPLPAAPAGLSCLPFGNGRSYGDCCVNADNCLIDARGMDRFIAFDRSSGRLECEAGVLLSEILELALPSGWFLPVTPGTQFVTVGGAIANDVHGKNHHRNGTFGHHVLEFELARTDGSRQRLTPDDDAELFRATVGGLGLTGLITRATIQLKPVAGPWIDQSLIAFANLDEFCSRSAESDQGFEHTVAWVDCIASGPKLGRGLMMCGDHADAPPNDAPSAGKRMNFPLTPPISLVNGISLRMFNELYYRVKGRQAGDSRMHYQPFFYPLDNILNWNRMYGPKGFFQYQNVVPLEGGQEAMREMLERIGRSGQGSFLAVLKRFGDQPAAGMLSFPRPGYTLALDFPNRGARTLRLLESLDEVTRQCGGAVYPAKDARMSAASFQAYYPEWERFSKHIDPGFSSSFWRRVTESTA